MKRVKRCNDDVVALLIIPSRPADPFRLFGKHVRPRFHPAQQQRNSLNHSQAPRSRKGK